MTNLTQAQPETLREKRYFYEWYVVILCMVAYIFSFVDRQILALMIEPIKADLQLTDTQFSLLHGLAFSLFYAFMGMPIAYLADRFSRPRIIALGVIFWSIATAACGLSKNFVQMFLARIGVGVGEAALSPSAYSMFSDMFPKEKLGRAVGIYSIGSFVGGGVAFLVGGYVIAMLKDAQTIEVAFLGAMKAWQLAFFIVGLPGVIVGLLIWLTVRDPQRKGAQLDADGKVRKVRLTDGLRFIGRHRATFACHYLGFSFYAMALYCMLSWTPALYIRKFGMSPEQAGFMLGSILLLANTTGVVFGGWLTDHLAKRGRSDAAMRTGVIGAVGMIVPAALYSQVDQLWLSVTLLVPAMFFASFPMPASTAAMQILSPNQVRAQVSAVFLLISNLLALGLGTTLVALITDRYFGVPAAVGSSMSIVSVFASFLAIVLLAKGCKCFRASMQREHPGAA
ncbi:MFS transporter [Pseudomonas putida]|uniref:spinster family MFS transporter n=1 Tax=Pseudomonas TaxID=286 RepID=UPI001059AF96|nr:MULTISPECIES: MFS transporter [Pseudomonas]MBF8747802.1 MFS transporter [Pseudomonas monteilii]MCT8165670.1 MFS transporter [Pseudomonas sp. HD6422]MCT8184738.1 MFS transporter [Pseudomonas sp. HD6421]TDJ79471.1 MFS transporter [Pseudomonas putida]